MENKNIYKALTSIIGEVSAIGKNQKNQQQGFMFRGIDDVMNELHTLFGKYKVVIIPEVIDYNVQEHTTSSSKLMYTTRSTIKFHFVADDGSEIVTTNVGEAMDMADKGINKTMSCALKYALMQMFLIPTKEIEDADRITPDDTMPTQQPAPTAQPQQTSTNEDRKVIKDVTKVLAMIKAATTLDELKKIQDGVNASNLYQSEMQENGVLYVAFFNRAQDVNK